MIGWSQVRGQVQQLRQDPARAVSLAVDELLVRSPLTPRVHLVAPPGESLRADQVVHVFLPRVLGTRMAVQDVLAEQRIRRQLQDRLVLLLCGDLSTGSPVAADELVVELMVHRGAMQMGLLGCSERFSERIHESLRTRQLTSRLRTDIPTWMIP